MLPIDQARATCDRLSSIGVRAMVDPRKVAPPCILIVPPTVRLDSMCDSGEAQWTAYALAGTGAGNADAWEQLELLVAKVLAVLPLESVQPSEYAVDPNTTYPAMTLGWSSPVGYTMP